MATSAPTPCSDPWRDRAVPRRGLALVAVCVAKPGWNCSKRTLLWEGKNVKLLLNPGGQLRVRDGIVGHGVRFQRNRPHNALPPRNGRRTWRRFHLRPGLSDQRD